MIWNWPLGSATATGLRAPVPASTTKSAIHLNGVGMMFSPTIERPHGEPARRDATVPYVMVNRIRSTIENLARASSFLLTTAR
ncbi:MAG: hypothetical protein SF069_07400 [Phycisphaerae bacterium]|nr:hypothetical protein [Phycisphaerae bacterium]